MTKFVSRSLATAVLILAAATVANGQEATAAAVPTNPYTPPACVPGVPFSDITCTTGFDPWIEQFGLDGITAGCGGGLYCPSAPVTRNQMAVFIEKAMHGTSAWSLGDLGHSNTGLGHDALVAIGSGTNNTAVGNGAMLNDSSGSDNTGVGAFALFVNAAASKNTAVGSGALQNQSYDPGYAWESNNTALGYNALANNQPTAVGEATDNTAVGAQALQANTTGLANTAIGYQSLLGNTTAQGSTAIGYGSLVTTTGTSNTGTGVSSGQGNISGSYNTFLGAYSAAATGNLSNATALGYDATVDSSNKVRIGNNGVTVIEGQVAWSWPSDVRLKENIRDLGLGLDFVMQLRPVSFSMKQGNGRTDMGFLAQDLEALLGDDYNVLGIGGDKDRTLSLRGTDLIAPLVKAVQEQQSQIDELRAQVQALLAERQAAKPSALP